MQWFGSCSPSLTIISIPHFKGKVNRKLKISFRHYAQSLTVETVQFDGGTFTLCSYSFTVITVINYERIMNKTRADFSAPVFYFFSFSSCAIAFISSLACFLACALNQRLCIYSTNSGFVSPCVPFLFLTYTILNTLLKKYCKYIPVGIIAITVGEWVVMQVYINETCKEVSKYQNANCSHDKVKAMLFVQSSFHCFVLLF